jgi:hypothetical protein
LSHRIFYEHSEAVEKGSLVTPCDFRIIKNQEVTSDGKSKNDRIWGFSTASADSCILEKLHERKAGPLLTSRSLNVLKKLEKALNHKGSWPFLLRKNL